MEQLELQSSNIKCAGCVANIEKGLTGLLGITEIKVDVASNMVTVRGTEMVQSDIETKLNELGYPVL